MSTLKVLSPEDLSNEDCDIIAVPMDDKGSVMYIGSLSADDFVEWSDMKDNGTPEDKKNAYSILMMKSLVKGPDKGPEGKPLTAEERKAASARIGTQAHVMAFHKAKVSRTERLLKAILKLNYINQRDEIAVKNA